MRRGTIALLSGAIVLGATLLCTFMQAEAFNNGCNGHLHRAATASTPEVAAVELDTAIAWAEAHGLTQGSTSAFYASPADDLGYWYQNLRGARASLRAVATKDASALERSNVLLKLKETLAPVPEGVTCYPHNLAMGLWLYFGLFLVVAGLVLSIIEMGTPPPPPRKKMAVPVA
jgi:hypothetical protein